jgi:hypothetical protein
MELSAQPKQTFGRFEVGRVSASTAAGERLGGREMLSALARHTLGDWCDSERELNELAIRRGYTVVSKFVSQSGVRYRITTNGERTQTRIELEDEACRK